MMMMMMILHTWIDHFLWLVGCFKKMQTDSVPFTVLFHFSISFSSFFSLYSFFAPFIFHSKTKSIQNSVMMMMKTVQSVCVGLLTGSLWMTAFFSGSKIMRVVCVNKFKSFEPRKNLVSVRGSGSLFFKR